MASWYGHSRSNYFKVKNAKKFQEFCDKWGAKMITNKFLLDEKNKAVKKLDPLLKERYAEEGTLLHGLTGDDEFGGLPSCLWDDDGNEKANFDDFLKELATHLADSWIAVLQEVGAEKLCYITGVSIAINSKGEQRNINLDNIYKEAESLGEHMMPCQY